MAQHPHLLHGHHRACCFTVPLSLLSLLPVVWVPLQLTLGSSSELPSPAFDQGPTLSALHSSYSSLGFLVLQLAERVLLLTSHLKIAVCSHLLALSIGWFPMKQGLGRS